jgi:hypothetical protein
MNDTIKRAIEAINFRANYDKRQGYKIVFRAVKGKNKNIVILKCTTTYYHSHVHADLHFNTAQAIYG